MRLEYSVNGSDLAPLVSAGAAITGTPGYIPIFNSGSPSVLQNLGTFSQDISRGRLTFGDSSVANVTSQGWTFWLRQTQSDQHGLLIALAGTPGPSSTNTGLMIVRNDPASSDVTFRVTAEGDITHIRRIPYHWPTDFPAGTIE